MVRGTSAGRGKAIAIAIVAFHIALLAAYTFPDRIVPERLRILGQAWARPLFHQQWKLFAPDPPLCSCEVQYRYGDGRWLAIDRGPDTYLARRSVQGVARYVQAEVHAGNSIPSPKLLRAMWTMVLYSGYEPGPGRPPPPKPAFRLVEHCVADTGEPSKRFERITPLDTP